MEVHELRNEAFLEAVGEHFDRLVDRLLDFGVDLPDVQGDFQITIDGIPACVVDRALLGSNAKSRCNFSSLNQSFPHRTKLKAAFPATRVAVIAGKCPLHLGNRRIAA
jgi:hypothetical protein